MSDSTKKMHMKGMIMMLLISVVGLAVTPTIVVAVNHITAIDQTDRPGQTLSQNTSGIIWGSNLTRGAARTVMMLFPVFWVLLIIAIPVVYLALWLRGN